MPRLAVVVEIDDNINDELIIVRLLLMLHLSYSAAFFSRVCGCRFDRFRFLRGCWRIDVTAFAAGSRSVGIGRRATEIEKAFRVLAKAMLAGVLAASRLLPHKWP